MIIFINGSINSGKSTVSKILAEKIERPAVIEIDSLSDFIEWMPIEEKIEINLENAISLIRNFSKRGFNVIVPYPLSQKNYDHMIGELNDLNDKIFVFTLNPEKDVALKNRGGRELDDWEKQRIEYHYSIGINNPSFGIIIDNTNQVAKETAESILNYIK
jgi:adenylate kinase family enzyme